MQLIECVPNFSEGRNLGVINEIARVIATVNGAHLLHKDIGHAVNRTVMTIAGSPKAVVEAAFNAIDYASRLIDMRKHYGEHPRIGATDVCPIIPLSGITMAECVDLSIDLAKRVGAELKIPVYLYGESAHFPERKNLPYLRKGGYESLAMRMKGAEFKPDFGPSEFNARSGATVIGARKILVAYNLNLDTKNLNIAHSIGQTIRKQRQSGQLSLSENKGDKTDDVREEKVFNWRNCQAIGWFVKEYKCCQISMNLLDYQTTPLADVFLAVSELARQHGTKITGSEIIGLVPLSALLKAGKFAIYQAGIIDKALVDEVIIDEAPVNERSLIDAAVKFLKLDQHQSFIASEKVLEYKLAEFGLNAKIEF